MAILPEFPGFEATVVVNGAVCEELLAPTDADEDDPTLVTRYIEATPGANFEVHVCVPPNAKYINDYDIAVWVKVDGQLILKPLFRKYIGKRHPRIIKGLEELSNTGWIRRDLVFSNLSTDDSPGQKIDNTLINRVSKLGQITVEFFRVNSGERREAHSFGWTEGLDSVPEKALKGKALSHKASLTSTKTPVQAPIRFHSEYVDPEDSPCAKICFHYRSLNDLKAEMIILRSPSPVPLENKPIEELTLEESRELLRRQREQAVRVKQEQICVKREREISSAAGHEDDDNLRIVKPKRRRVKSETIDLTDD